MTLPFKVFIIEMWVSLLRLLFEKRLLFWVNFILVFIFFIDRGIQDVFIVEQELFDWLMHQKGLDYRSEFLSFQWSSECIKHLLDLAFNMPKDSVFRLVIE